MKLSGFNSKMKSGARVVLDVDGSKCFDLRKVAGKFNSFFTGVARSLVDKLPRPMFEFAVGSASFRQFYLRRGS